jgi:site-specific DNA-methyltransferase (adenine-specific)
MDAVTLHHGDALDVLRGLADDSVDAVVTDPPYGLSDHDAGDVAEALACWLSGEEYVHGRGGFMGRSWDAFVPGPVLWREVYRVLKPGGHLLCFAGTRTQDLMGIAIRLAGFECRDTLQWLYGSGFPKSHDVSKAIDRNVGEPRPKAGAGRIVDRNALDYGGATGKAKKLHSTGLSWRRMDELGLEYRYLARYLRGTISKADMIVQLENEIWHYAKRQRTWWKRNPDIHWATRK